MDEALGCLTKGFSKIEKDDAGRRPAENDLFSIYVNEGANSDAHDFKMHGAIRSGPGDLLGLSFRRRRLTSSTQQSMFASFLSTIQSCIGKFT